MIGNWSLACKKEGELQIHNSDGQQVTTFTQHAQITKQVAFSSLMH